MRTPIVWRVITVALAVIASISLVTSAVAMGFGPAGPQHEILQGVSIDGLPVSGLTPSEAKKYIGNYLTRLTKTPVILKYADMSWDIRPGESGVEIDLDQMVEAAYRVGRRGNLFRQLRERLTVVRKGHNVGLRMAAVDPGDLQRRLDSIAEVINQEPVPARIKIQADDAITVVPSQEGRRVDLDALVRHIVKAAQRPNERVVNVPVVVTTPHPTTAEIADFGIETLVAGYTTRFDPANANRAKNIEIAASALDGHIIAPGDEFSFNRVVGPRAARSGYKEAPVIVDGVLVPDVGGGVCQVSTTLYNAVLEAGLHVTQRISHSIPATYVPLGRDATVAYDYIDFRFRNGGNHYLLIHTEVSDSSVTVKFFGDHRVIPPQQFVSHVDEVLEPKIQIVQDPTLALGQRSVEREGRRGFKVTLVARFAQGDATEERIIDHSTYKAWDRVVRVGTGFGPDLVTEHSY